MTEQELAYDATSAVTHWDAEGIVATSATVTLTKPDGTTVESPTVTLPTLSTTTAAGATASILILASVTGILRGDRLRVTSAGQDYVVEASTVNGTAKTVALIAALPVTPTVGDAVKSLKMTATLAAVGSAGVGANYRITWVYTNGTTPRQVGYPAAVVRWPWTAPCSAADVRDVAISISPGHRSETWCADVAARVDSRIRAAVSQTGRRPSLFLSSAVFVAAARAGIFYELSMLNICFGGQVYEAQRELRFAFDDALTTVINGLTAYDADADGAISTAEAKPMHYTMQAAR